MDLANPAQSIEPRRGEPQGSRPEEPCVDVAFAGRLLAGFVVDVRGIATAVWVRLHTSQGAGVKDFGFARFSSTPLGLIDLCAAFGAPSRAFPRKGRPVAPLCPPRVFEDRLRVDVARGLSVRVARVGLENLNLLEPLGDLGLSDLVAILDARIAAIAGPDQATSPASGEYLVRVPAGAAQVLMFRAAVRDAVSRPIAPLGVVPGLDARIGLALAPRDGVSLAAIADAALIRSRSCRLERRWLMLSPS